MKRMRPYADGSKRYKKDPTKFPVLQTKPDTSHSAIMCKARQWQAAVDAIPTPIFIHDANHRILRANKAYAQEACLPVHDVIGKPYWQIFPRLSGPLPGCLQTQAEQETFEDSIYLEDGRLFISSGYVAATSDMGYQFSVHVLREVTGELNHKLENMPFSIELRNTDKFVSYITGAIPYILFDFDFKSMLPVYVSSAVQVLLGYEPKDFTKAPASWIAIVHEDDREFVLKEIDNAINNRRGAEFECRLRHKYLNETIWFEVRARCVLDASDHISQFIGIASDITERKKFIEERVNATLKIRNSHVQSINAIASLVEVRDPYTAGHQRRVAEISAAIARKMGLDEDRIHGIELGAQVHDIGKIHVPAEILNRSGILTAPEFELIKSHPVVGYEILKAVDFPWPIAHMVRQHHERLDGSGYPDGLRGNSIILEARILAVADVIDAITSHRPYRPRREHNEAIEEINRKQGILYDPYVVDACNLLVADGCL